MDIPGRLLERIVIASGPLRGVDDARRAIEGLYATPPQPFALYQYFHFPVYLVRRWTELAQTSSDVCPLIAEHLDQIGIPF